MGPTGRTESGGVCAGSLRLGQGVPKLCVPVVGHNLTEVLENAEAALACGPDLAEWRADWLDDPSEERVSEVLRALRQRLGKLPLLATFRSRKEGGRQNLSPAAYEGLHRLFVTSGCVELVDVELYACETVEESETVMCRLTAFARERGVVTVGSSHDFSGTPSEKEMIFRMERMARLGCDVAKLAVMPQSARDVLTLLSATETVRRRHPELPLITMSMGRLGTVTRLCGEVFGSAVTFGSAGEASAPGQPDAAELRRALRLIHGED